MYHHKNTAVIGISVYLSEKYPEESIVLEIITCDARNEISERESCGNLRYKELCACAAHYK